MNAFHQFSVQNFHQPSDAVHRWAFEELSCRNGLHTIMNQFGHVHSLHLTVNENDLVEDSVIND